MAPLKFKKYNTQTFVGFNEKKKSRSYFQYETEVIKKLDDLDEIDDSNRDLFRD
jgi:hypothetical protein